jgi:hypothetical protein
MAVACLTRNQVCVVLTGGSSWALSRAAAPIVVYLGGYPVLSGLTAIDTILGSVLVLRIRSVP